MREIISIEHTLTNGIHVILTPMESAQSVSIVCSLCVGSRYESADITGISHVIEHMVFKGSEHFPSARKIAEAIEDAGGDLNGSTTKETTEYSVLIDSRHFDTAAHVLADMLQRPLFLQEDIDKERRVILEELRMTRDTPQDWADSLLNQLLYANHPLGAEILGSADSLQALTRAAIQRYYGNYYTPDNLVISIAGGIDSVHALDTVAADFGQWAGQGLKDFLPFNGVTSEKRFHADRRNIEQVSLCMAYPGLSYRDKDVYVLDVLTAILGRGMSSRLFQSIREDGGLAYEIGASSTEFYETGAVNIFAGCDYCHMTDVIQATLRETESLAQNGPSVQELARAISYTLGGMALKFEDTLYVAEWRADQKQLLGKLHSLNEIQSAVANVTADDAMRLAQKLFQREKLHITAIGPKVDEQLLIYAAAN